MMRVGNFVINKRASGLSTGHMHGASLSGLLIATVIGMPIIGGALVLYANTLESSAQMNSTARVQESGRFAIEHIGRSLRMARFDDPVTTGSAAVVPALIGTTSSDTSLSLVGFTLKSGTDVVSTSYEGAPQTRDCQGITVASDTWVTNTYALSDANELICGTAANPVVVAEGVEDMQILYGVDTDNPADFTANRYLVSAGVSDWSQVVSVKVSMLINSVDEVFATTIHGCPSCDTFTPTADRLLRAEFHTTIRLRNTIE